MKKFILAIFLILMGFIAFTGFSNQGLSFTQQEDIVFSFPGGDDDWNDDGILSGSMTDDNGTLRLSSTTNKGSFDSNEIKENDSLSLRQIAVDATIPSGTAEEATLTVRTYDENDVLQNSETYTIQDGYKDYNLSTLNGRKRFDHFDFTIEITKPDSTHIEIHETSFLAKKYLDTSTSGLPIGFANLIAYILWIIAIVLILPGA